MEKTSPAPTNTPLPSPAAVYVRVFTEHQQYTPDNQGDLLYGEGAYLHDLREELFSNAGEGLWRRTEHTQRNGNLYPTHGFGPVANYLGIQRGDRFSYMVSMSSPQRGLDRYRTRHVKTGDSRLSEKYVTGDMNTSLIKTAKGLTINLKYTVSTPHPYDRVNQIAGTEGIFEDYPPRVYLDGQKTDESWGTLDKWKQYEHRLSKKEGEVARKMGRHGGTDYIMLCRLLQCVRQGMAPDMDVYDAAAWSNVAELSVKSVSNGKRADGIPRVYAWTLALATCLGHRHDDLASKAADVSERKMMLADMPLVTFTLNFLGVTKRTPRPSILQISINVSP